MASHAARRGNAYRGFSRRSQIDVEVTPEFLDLAGFDHIAECFPGKFGIASLTPVAAFEGLFVRQVARTVEVVDDPFVEVKAPVGERVGHCGSVFAVSRRRSCQQS